MKKSEQMHTYCIDTWEAAYTRFETPEEEVDKFIKRLKRAGAFSWPQNSEIVELFCGRGNGLKALSKFGFTRLEGVDLSDKLLALYKGKAKCYLADCKKLPFQDSTKDIVVIHGGLHHLRTLAEIDQTFLEISRVLKKEGKFFVVEPWLTPFLSFAHMLCNNEFARWASKKIDALSIMITLEQQTYDHWLSQPDEILNIFDKYFKASLKRISWGKLFFLGYKP